MLEINKLIELFDNKDYILVERIESDGDTYVEMCKLDVNTNNVDSPHIHLLSTTDHSVERDDFYMSRYIYKFDKVDNNKINNEIKFVYKDENAGSDYSELVVNLNSIIFSGYIEHHSNEHIDKDTFKKY